MPLTTWASDLAAVASLEPQRVNHILMHIVPSASVPVDADLTLCLESFPTPKFSVGTIEVAYLNEKRKYAGNPVWDDIQVVYKDMVTKQIQKKLHDWYKLVYDSTTAKVGLASSYKRNAYVIGYGPDGTASWQWDCFGVWPNNYDGGDADMGGEDYVRVNIGYVIDKCILSATPETPPAAYSAI